MFQTILNKMKNPEITAEALLEIASDFPTTEMMEHELPANQIERKKSFLLGCLLFDFDHLGITNDLLQILIKNKKVPFEKLSSSTLDGIARKEITDMGLFLTAIQRFKDNPDFILGIKNNHLLYPQFMEQYKKAIDDFNAEVNSHLESLEIAKTLDDINKVRAQEKELEQKRQRILEQYPEEAVPDELIPEKVLLKIAELTEVAKAAKTVKETEELFDNLRNQSAPDEQEITFAWDKFKRARHDLNKLLFSSSYETECKSQRATHSLK